MRNVSWVWIEALIREVQIDRNLVYLQKNIRYTLNLIILIYFFAKHTTNTTVQEYLFWQQFMDNFNY